MLLISNWISDVALGILTDLGNWVLSIIKGILICILAYPISMIGYHIRMGIEKKKALQEVKINPANRGRINIYKWNDLNNQATQQIIAATIGLLGLIAAYIIMYRVLPFQAFLWSLLGVIPLVLGYFGQFLAPSEPNDPF